MLRVQLTTAIRRDAARSSAAPKTRSAGRRLLGVAAAAATVAGVGLAAPQALAAPVSSHQHPAVSPATRASHVASVTSRKPFRIKAGRVVVPSRPCAASAAF